jgi:hypothetical protein
MQADIFYQQVVGAVQQPPPARHDQLSRLHTQVFSEYLTVLRRIASEQAATVVSDIADQRTIGQIVGHIAAWEQFALIAAGDLLAGVQHPRMVTDLRGFVDSDGSQPQFATIAEFNAYHAAKHADWTWDQVQSLAIDVATAQHVLFTHPQLLNAQRLEQTRPWHKRLQSGQVIENIHMGWHLWITMLEHEAVEHARELGLPNNSVEYVPT